MNKDAYLRVPFKEIAPGTTGNDNSLRNTHEKWSMTAEPNVLSMDSEPEVCMPEAFLRVSLKDIARDISDNVNTARTDNGKECVSAEPTCLSTDNASEGGRISPEVEVEDQILQHHVEPKIGTSGGGLEG